MGYKTVDPQLGDLARLLKVLSDPTRLRIFNTLMEGVQCNCELGEALGLPMNLISHHLRVLREAGLVRSERDGLDARWVYYSVDENALQELRTWLHGFLDPARIQPRLPTCGPTYAGLASSVEEVEGKR
jgi:ArsR family transcriptional regulator